MFDAAPYITRDCCGPWTASLRNTYQLSALVMLAAYLFVSLCLVWLYAKRRKAIPRSYVILIFSGIFLSCGLTHLCTFLAFVWPAYRLFVSIELGGALVSFVGAFMLPGIFRYLASVPSPEEMASVNAALERTNGKYREAVAKLVARTNEQRADIKQLQDAISHAEWSESVKAQALSMLTLLRQAESGTTLCRPS